MTWMIRAMRDGAGRVSGQRLHSITRTSYHPRTFMLVSAEVVRALLPSPHAVLYVPFYSLCSFVWCDVARWRRVSSRGDDPHLCEWLNALICAVTTEHERISFHVVSVFPSPPHCYHLTAPPHLPQVHNNSSLWKNACLWHSLA